MTNIIHKSSRAFNEVVIDKTYGLVRKSSKDGGKLSAEFNWYLHLPQQLQGLAPRPISCVQEVWKEQSTLTMEYCPYSTLSELFTDPRVKVNWERILLRLLEVYDLFQNEAAPMNIREDILQFHVQKSTDRINKLKKFPELEELAVLPILQINGRWCKNIDFQDLMNRLKRNAYLIKPAVVHGDYCLSNILYDLNSDSVKLIDPRGYLLDKSEPSFYGDAHYDFAKLMHSIEGMYDFMVQGRYTLLHWGEGRYELSFGCPTPVWLSRILDSASQKVNALEYRKILQVLLFVTMIPLHYDDTKRQIAFYLRAVQLYNELI